MKLIDVLKLYNFQLYRDDYQYDCNKNNTSTIRVIFDNHTRYFEFGIDDWCSNNEKLDTIKEVINSKLLNKNVKYFRTNPETSVFEITLED